jgi:hypothetical protein
MRNLSFSSITDGRSILTEAENSEWWTPPSHTGVTTVGELSEAIGRDKIVSISPDTDTSLARRVAAQKRQPPSIKAGDPNLVFDDTPLYRNEAGDPVLPFEGLVRRMYKRYRKRFRDNVLLEAIADVAESKRWPTANVSRMTIREFNAALDEIQGCPRFGPDPDRPILYWDGKPYELHRRNWEFLTVVWGRMNVPHEEIGEHVWSDEGVPGGRIRKVIFELNKQLREYGIDFCFESEGERVCPISDYPQ